MLLPNRDRYRVNISCQKCGERFILKGRLRKGKIETGFKKCICDNEFDFIVENQPY